MDQRGSVNGGVGGDSLWGKPVAGVALHSNRNHCHQQPVAVRRKRIGRRNLDADADADSDADTNANVLMCLC